MYCTIRVVIGSLIIWLATGCAASQHLDSIRGDNNGPVTDITVGTVQKEIFIGMPASDVAAELGSPNIVTTDEERREVWIYDKISTEVAYSNSRGGIAGLRFGDSGAVTGAASADSGAAASSQRTLTVIIKFDHESKVRDFSYRTSRF